MAKDLTKKEIKDHINREWSPLEVPKNLMKNLYPICGPDCLVCASFFEFNITGEEFRKSYVDHGGSEHLADHMWGKFDGYKHSILKLIGSADFANRTILTDVVNDWCKAHPKDVKR